MSSEFQICVSFCKSGYPWLFGNNGSALFVHSGFTPSEIQKCSIINRLKIKNMGGGRER